MTRGVDTAAVEFVSLQNILSVEVPQTTATPVQCVLPRQLGHEPPEVFYPGIVLIPVEQVDSPLKHLPRIERVAALPLIVEEGLDVDTDPQLVFDGGDVGYLDGIVELI